MNFIIDPRSFINLDFNDNNNKQYGKGNNKKKKKTLLDLISSWMSKFIHVKSSSKKSRTCSSRQNSNVKNTGLSDISFT